MSHKELVIVGGGPVGLSMAISLAQGGKKVTLLDQGLKKAADGRILALSLPSQQFLSNLGAWPQETTAINQVQISHAGLGISQIKAQDLGLSNLGFTVSYAELCAKLLDIALGLSLIELVIADVVKVSSNNSYSCVEYLEAGSAKLMSCDLLIMAEGGKLLTGLSNTQAFDYRQQAIVAHIKTRIPHQGVAHERFGNLGPLVLLPYQDHYVVVWSLAEEQVSSFIADPLLFISSLDELFTKRLGGAKLLGALHTFPLKLQQIKSRIHGRMVLIGNSAQLVHPVSAQGLNLGLRDVISLSEALLSVDYNSANLAQWNKSRQRDVDAVVAFTHFLATKMEPQSKLLQHLRGAGIIALSNLPSIQNQVAQSLIFGVMK